MKTFIALFILTTSLAQAQYQNCYRSHNFNSVTKVRLFGSIKQACREALDDAARHAFADCYAEGYAQHECFVISSIPFDTDSTLGFSKCKGQIVVQGRQFCGW
jgi:hypothetical protein